MRRVIAGILLLSFAFAGCTRSGANGNAAGASGPANTLRIANYAEPTSLNPLLASDTAENFLASLAFDELVTIDDSGNEVPDLAAVVPTLQNGGISKDGLTITYHLRRNVKWQDGAPLRSNDVKFSWQAVMNPDNNVVERRGYDQVSSVDTPDPFTVVFHLKAPFAPFVDTVFGESDEPFRVVPAHLLAKYHDINKIPFNQLPIGTGPFKVVRWVHGDHIEYAANPSYFRGAPKIERLFVYTIPDGNTDEAELRSHDTDVVIDIPTANLANLRDRPSPGITTLLAKGPQYYSVVFNLKHSPLDDVRVRRAFAYAIDEPQIIRTLTYDTATPAKADLSDFYWAYDPNVTTYPYNPSKANQLLDEAGWKRGPNGIREKNGRPLSVQLVYGQGNSTARADGVEVQSDLKAVGVDTQIKTYTYTMFYATKAAGGILTGGKYDIALYGWVAGADPDNSSSWMCSMAPPAGNNVTNYCNAAFDAAEQDALTHFDRARRKNDYAIIQSLLARDVPAAFQYYQRVRYALSTRVHNFRPNGISEGWNAYEWYIR